MSRRDKTPNLFHRAVAAMSAALVVALTFFAASPTAHNWLHSEVGSHTCQDHAKSPPAPDGDQGCVVVLFASGVDTPVAAITLVPPQIVARAILPITAEEFYLVSPRYLRQPERGPPSSRVA